MGKRGVKQTSVHCEWTLNHQFIQFHYGAADAKLEYEAFVFIASTMTRRVMFATGSMFLAQPIPHSAMENLMTNCSALNFDFFRKTASSRISSLSIRKPKLGRR